MAIDQRRIRDWQAASERGRHAAQRLLEYLRSLMLRVLPVLRGPVPGLERSRDQDQEQEPGLVLRLGLGQRLGLRPEPGAAGGLWGMLALAVLLLVAPAPGRAEFQGVDYTLTNQNGQDFSGQNLAQTSFAGAQGRDARFEGADLHGAILTQAAFPRASFRGADLSDALMDKVDFAGADFRDAVLRGVIATGSSFSGAQVTGADFTDALLDRVDQRNLCREASGTNPTTGVDTRLSLDC